MNNYKQYSIKCQVEKAKGSCKGVEILLSHLIAELNNRDPEDMSPEDIMFVQNVRAIRDANRETFYWTQLALDEASTGLKAEDINGNVEQEE